MGIVFHMIGQVILGQDDTEGPTAGPTKISGGNEDAPFAAEEGWNAGGTKTSTLQKAAASQQLQRKISVVGRKAPKLEWISEHEVGGLLVN